jgi:hypothetical protein
LQLLLQQMLLLQSLPRSHAPLDALGEPQVPRESCKVSGTLSLKQAALVEEVVGVAASEQQPN